MLERERTAAVDVRHQRHQVLGDGEGTRALCLVVALQVHVAVRTLYRLAFVLNMQKKMLVIFLKLDLVKNFVFWTYSHQTRSLMRHI